MIILYLINVIIPLKAARGHDKKQLWLRGVIKKLRGVRTVRLKKLKTHWEIVS